MSDQMFEALLNTITDLNEAEPSLKTLIYGNSGVGKTVLAVQLAQAIRGDRTVIYIDSREGWVSLLNHEASLRTSVQRVAYKGLSQIDILADAIEMKRAPFDNVGVIIVDEVSTIQTYDLDTVLKVNAAKIAGKDANVPTQPDFYANTERMRRAVGRLMMLSGVDIIFVAHEREDKDQRTGVVTTSPDFTPKFSKSFRQDLHLVGRLVADEITKPDSTDLDYNRRVQVFPTRAIVAKTRIGGLKIHVPIDELKTALVEWKRGTRKESSEGEQLPKEEPVEHISTDEIPEGEMAL